MLQVFYINVTKVNQDVAMSYTCMFQVYVPNISFVSDVCCTCFHLAIAKLDRDVPYICKCFRCFSYVCWCFILMFAMTTHAFSSFLWCFASVSDVYCKCFSYFGCMLQVFHLDVAKTHRVLHMFQCVWEVEGAWSLHVVCRHRHCPGNVGPRGHVKCRLGRDVLVRAQENECSAGVRMSRR
jgi:hypothetical protein